jgi:hypothetical protein
MGKAVPGRASGASIGGWYMGWHTVDGRGYYYRNRWKDGRSIREYIGTGLIGEAAAAADARRRLEQEAQARAWREEQARWDAALGPLLELIRVSDLLLEGVLLASGYHRHDRTWRKRRVRKPQPQDV